MMHFHVTTLLHSPFYDYSGLYGLSVSKDNSINQKMSQIPLVQHLQNYFNEKTQQADFTLEECMNSLPDIHSREEIFQACYALILSGFFQFNYSPKSTKHLAVNNFEKKEKPDSLTFLVSTFVLYRLVFQPSNWAHFHNQTSNEFKEHYLVELLCAQGATLEDMELLFRFICAYHLDLEPPSIQDLKLPLLEYLKVHRMIMENQHPLQILGLLDFLKESRGLCVDMVLKDKLIAILLQGSEGLVTRPPHSDSGPLFKLISHKDIEAVTLQINLQERLHFEVYNQSISNASVFTLLLHGASGTGKTEWVYQLARETQSDVMHVQIAHLRSKWIGETEKHVHQVFESYRKLRRSHPRPLILFLNEADGLLSQRVSISQSNDAFHNQVQTVLLELLEKFEGVLMATTNVFELLDKAYERRFLFTHAMEPPDLNCRKQILASSVIRDLLPENLKCSLEQGSWSIGSFRNLEKKLALMAANEFLDRDLLQQIIWAETKPLVMPRSIGYQ